MSSAYIMANVSMTQPAHCIDYKSAPTAKLAHAASVCFRDDGVEFLKAAARHSGW